MDYHIKYIKYKKKYHELKKLYGGLNKLDFEEDDYEEDEDYDEDDDDERTIKIKQDLIENSSDEDLVDLPLDFFKKLKTIYPSTKHDEERLDNEYKGHPITYGEMEYKGINKLIKHLLETHKVDFKTFIDLGSGRGKLPFYVAGFKQINKSIGVEIVKERHEDAVEIKRRLQEHYEIVNKVILINNDFNKVDILEYTRDISLVWISNLMFEQSLTDKLFTQLISKLPSNSIIACSKEHSLDSDKLTLLGRLRVPMSWKKDHIVYIYQIK